MYSQEILFFMQPKGGRMVLLPERKEDAGLRYLDNDRLLAPQAAAQNVINVIIFKMNYSQ